MRSALSLRWWKKRPVLIATGVLAIALVLLVASPGGKTANPSRPEPAAPAPSLVIVAARPVAAGTVIAEADIRTKAVTGTPPARAILSGDAATGRIAGKSFAPGELLLQDNLTDAAQIGIAARVPQGQRAFSIRVAEDEIVGGFLQSGDSVDVFATIPGSAFPARDAQNLPDRSQTVLLLQNVLVLAVGENPATRGSVQASARTVSLSLPPAQLARLTLALRYGKVSLAIRKPGDTVETDTPPATLADLVAPPAPAAPAAVRAPAGRHTAGIPFYSGTRTTVAQWSGVR